jgi:hypothetical protein
LEARPSVKGWTDVGKPNSYKSNPCLSGDAAISRTADWEKKQWKGIEKHNANAFQKPMERPSKTANPG